MKTWKLTLAALFTIAAFVTHASAISTVSINDNYTGENPAGDSNSYNAQDGRDVVGDRAIFGIDSMNVVFNESALSSVSIYTNSVKNDTNFEQYGTDQRDHIIKHIWENILSARTDLSLLLILIRTQLANNGNMPLY